VNLYRTIARQAFSGKYTSRQGREARKGRKGKKRVIVRYFRLKLPISALFQKPSSLLGAFAALRLRVSLRQLNLSYGRKTINIVSILINHIDCF